MMTFQTILVTLLALFAHAIAESCSSTLTASYPAPSIASGFTARLIANNLTRPRGILFDSVGHLLVVESGYGITSLTLSDGGGACLGVSKKQDIVKDSGVRQNVTRLENCLTHISS